jgi:hypothetical protein
MEGRVLAGRQGVEGDVLMPWLGEGTDHKPSPWLLRQDAQPCARVSSTRPRDAPCRNGSPCSMVGIARSQKMSFTTGDCIRSMSRATANVTDADAPKFMGWSSSTSGSGSRRPRQARN